MIEIAFSVRLLVALVFLTAAWGKARNRPVFQGVVANYRLLPEFLVAPVALALPPAEALVGAALLTPPLARWADVAAAGLLALFAAAMAVNLLRGRRNIDCGCFQSVLKQTLRWTLVARNGALILALGVAAAAPAGFPAPWRMAEGLLAGGTLFVTLQSLNILWSVVPAWHRPNAHSGGAGK